jgi:FeS assembly protein IscX
MEQLDWSDVHEIGFRLSEAHADVSPLSVRFTDLHAWVCALEGFIGDPLKSNEKVLEAIQMAWLDETED